MEGERGGLCVMLLTYHVGASVQSHQGVLLKLFYGLPTGANTILQAKEHNVSDLMVLLCLNYKALIVVTNTSPVLTVRLDCFGVLLE